MKSKRVGKWNIRLLKLGHTGTHSVEIRTEKYGTPFVATGSRLKRSRFGTYSEAKAHYDSLNTQREIFLRGLSCAGKTAYSDYAMYGGQSSKRKMRKERRI